MRNRTALLTLLAASCVSANAGPGESTPSLAGPWGAPGSALEITAEGAVLRESCSDITLGPIRPDASGSFSVRGRLSALGPGPQQADVPAQATEVSISGKVEGDVMTLTIAEPGVPARELSVQRGRRAKVIRCY